MNLKPTNYLIPNKNNIKKLKNNVTQNNVEKPHHSNKKLIVSTGLGLSAIASAVIFRKQISAIQSQLKAGFKEIAGRDSARPIVKKAAMVIDTYIGKTKNWNLITDPKTQTNNAKLIFDSVDDKLFRGVRPI